MSTEKPRIFTLNIAGVAGEEKTAVAAAPAANVRPPATAVAAKRATNATTDATDATDATTKRTIARTTAAADPCPSLCREWPMTSPHNTEALF